MEDREELEDLFDRVNMLISYLELINNDKLVEYVVEQVTDCGYCDYENFKEILQEE